jgi:hypothetical protein
VIRFQDQEETRCAESTCRSAADDGTGSRSSGDESTERRVNLGGNNMGVLKQADSSPVNLQLWYDTILVADLLNVSVHQGTWFAAYCQLVTCEQGKQETRLCDYITFCENWHKRLKRGESPGAVQFDQFRDVLKSGLWRVPCPDGSDLTMTEGPIFVEGEASWDHRNCEPSRELAAWAAWSRLSLHL